MASGRRAAPSRASVIRGMGLRGSGPPIQFLETGQRDRGLDIGEAFGVVGRQRIERTNRFPEIDVGIGVEQAATQRMGNAAVGENAGAGEEPLQTADLQRC